MRQVKDEVQAIFPGPNVGPEAQAGTLHPLLGRLRPHKNGNPRLMTWPARKAMFVEQAIDAGLLAPPTKAPAAASTATAAATKPTAKDRNKE
jgi:hypothetical protein